MFGANSLESFQYSIADDLLDLLTPLDKSDYPSSTAMKALVDYYNPSFPDSNPLGSKEFWDKHQMPKENLIADWATLCSYEVLKGFGHDSASQLQGSDLEALKQLASTFGIYLARELERTILRWEFFTTVFDFLCDAWVTLFRQFPDKALGEAIQGSLTPAYIRAHMLAQYTTALFLGDRHLLSEAQEVLEASDSEIEKGIREVWGTYSKEEIGRGLKAKTVEIATLFRNLFASDEIREMFHSVSPEGIKFIAWYLGYTLRVNMRSKRQTVTRLLRAMSLHHLEIEACIQEYGYYYSWGGDENEAVKHACQAVAPRYFSLHCKAENLRERDQEKFVGIWKAVKSYPSKKPLRVALDDAVSGRFTSYLVKSAKNQEIDYIRMINRQRGVKPQREWSQEGKTEEEIRRQIDKGIEDLRGRELLAPDFENPDGSITSALEQAEQKQSFDQWHEEERENFVAEKVEELCQKTKLTPRQQLVRQYYNKSDKEIALLLRDKFNKPVTPGAVRKLRHDLLKKLKKVANKK